MTCGGGGDGALMISGGDDGGRMACGGGALMTCGGGDGGRMACGGGDGCLDCCCGVGSLMCAPPVFAAPPVDGGG
jgi:hypothetical protein